MPKIEVTIKIDDINWEQYDEALRVLEKAIDKLPGKSMVLKKSKSEFPANCSECFASNICHQQYGGHICREFYNEIDKGVSK